jgi:sigma-E factor negative regulatory protein RseB
VNWLPAGFKPIKADKHRIAITKQPVEFMMFSDGLVDISVYVSNSSDKRRAAELITDGATVVLNQVNLHNEISVVGKVPPETAKAIADSIVFKAK